jgi:hypothetical protein
MATNPAMEIPTIAPTLNPFLVGEDGVNVFICVLCWCWFIEEESCA